MPYIDDSGVSLWYDVNGEGEPLVLTGGFALLHNQWDYIREYLSPHFKVIDWNYRGAGQSDLYWAGGYTLDRWVDDLEVILDSLKIENVNLLGTSTGSPITIRYTAKYQSRVKSMITYPLYKADPAFRHAFKIFQDVCEGFGHEGLARFTSWIGSATHNQFSEEGNRLALHEAETFKANFSIESLDKTLDTFAHIDLTSELRKITVPTMLLMGESGLLGCDMPSVADLARGFKAQCTHCKEVTVPDAGGTYYMFEKPKEAAEEVKKFISSLSG